jgi:hypothetical protein
MSVHTDSEHYDSTYREPYTDEDTARARQAQAAQVAGGPSSAGLPTQQLFEPPANNSISASDRRRDIGALVLIAIGVVAMLGQFVPASEDLMGGFVLLTIASVFLFFSFWQRTYGLLIPGCILAGLALGVPLATLTDGVSVLWGLALGFAAILLVGRALFRVQSPWPIFPAVILFGLGIVVAISNMPAVFAGSFIWLPILLILAGLYLGFARKRSM